MNHLLKTYLTFQPAVLFTPSVKRTVMLLSLFFALAVYLLSSNDIQKNGFQLPDSIIDTALKFTPQTQEVNENIPPIPQISKEQIEFLKKDPQALKQFGLTSQMLDNLEQSENQPLANPSTAFLKQVVKNQFENALKPYSNLIPIVIAVIFYFTLSFITSLIFLFIPFFLWLIYLILEKTGYIKFQTETREVKKMVA